MFQISGLLSTQQLYSVSRKFVCFHNWNTTQRSQNSLNSCDTTKYKWHQNAIICKLIGFFYWILTHPDDPFKNHTFGTFQTSVFWWFYDSSKFLLAGPVPNCVRCCSHQNQYIVEDYQNYQILFHVLHQVYTRWRLWNIKSCYWMPGFGNKRTNNNKIFSLLSLTCQPGCRNQELHEECVKAVKFRMRARSEPRSNVFQPPKILLTLQLHKHKLNF